MRTLLFASVVVSLFCAAPAEARFGKQSVGGGSSGSGRGSSGGGREHSASSPNSPSGGYSPAPSYGGGSYYQGRPYRGYGGYRGRGWYGGPRYRPYGFGYWYAPPPPVYAYPNSGYVQQEEPVSTQPSLTASLGAEAQAIRGGATLGLNFNLEGERLGMAMQFTGILIGTDDGTAGIDTIKLFNAEMTYAFVSNEYVRLRVEGGAHSAFAANLIALGPGLGLSGAFRIAGPLGFELGARVTPFPFRQLDASAALTVSVGMLGIKGGWRHIILDDAGMVDGVRNVDTFSGPFIGLALLL